MKKILSLMFVLVSFGVSQDTLFVPWSSAVDHLNNVILSDRDSDGNQLHDVYLLETGSGEVGVYYMRHMIEITGDLNITGGYSSDWERPAIIQPVANPDGSSGFTGWPQLNFRVIQNEAVLVLRNLIFNQVDRDQNFALDGVATAEGDRQKIIIDNSIVSGCKTLAFSSLGTSADFHFVNSIAKDWNTGPGTMFFGGLFWGGGSWMGTVDTLVVENSTVHDLFGNAIVIYEHVDHGLINQNTFANISMSVVWWRGQNNLTVKNNLFYNTKSYGQSNHDINHWGVWFSGGVGQMSIHPRYEESYVMEDDGQYVDLENRNINYHNNVWFHDVQLIDYMQRGPWSWESSEEDEDGNETMVTLFDSMLPISDQSKWLDDSTIVAIEQNVGIMESNNINVDPEIALDPSFISHQISRSWDFRDNQEHDTYPFTEPLWRLSLGMNPVNIEWPLNLDLSYNLDTPAGSASEEMGPVGDPRWHNRPGIFANALAFAQDYVNSNSDEYGQEPFDLVSEFSLDVDGHSVFGGLGGADIDNCDINWPTDPFKAAVYSFVSEYVLDQGASVGCFLENTNLDQSFAEVAITMEELWTGHGDGGDEGEGDGGDDYFSVNPSFTV